MKRPQWYKSTIKRLYQYPLDKKRLGLLQAKLESMHPATTANYSLAPAFSGPSDQTGKIASARAEMEREIKGIRERIREIDFALSAFSFENRQIIELRYFKNGNNDPLVYMVMHLPERTYYRRKDRAIKDIATVLGYYVEPQINILERNSGRKMADFYR